MARVRNWCFTSFEKLDWEALIGEETTYIIVGEEICPDTGRKHWQGYAEFSKQNRLSALKKLWKNDKIHWEPRRGSQEEAIKYCMKDGKFAEYGEKKEQGKRTDMTAVREMIQDGFTNAEIATMATSWQAINSTQKLREMLIEPRDDDVKPKVYWFYGPTGIGKTRKAKELCDHDYDDCDYKNEFLIGYTGKDTVIFDDFRGGIPFNLLLKMLDYGKCTVNTKGGCVNFGAKTVIFTSPRSPGDIYKNVKEDLAQLIRRIDHLEALDRIGSVQRSGEVILAPPPIYKFESDESDSE